MRTPFKQRSSPAKGKLQNFFNSVGKNLKRNKRDIGADLKSKHKGTKQTTNKAGEKIGYYPTEVVHGYEGGNTQQKRSESIRVGWKKTKAESDKYGVKLLKDEKNNTGIFAQNKKNLRLR